MSLSPSEVSDLYLIEQIKNTNNSEALVELVNRHTGVYINTINSYTFVPKIERDDLIESKIINIYKYALDYNPVHKTKFSSYVGLRAKYECQTFLTNRKNIVSEEPIDDNIIGHDDININYDCIDYILEKVYHNKDKRFIYIFQRRHLQDKPESFYKIGKDLNLSHEGAIKIYKRNIKALKKELVKDGINI